MKVVAPVGNCLGAASNGLLIVEGSRSPDPEYRSLGGAILDGPYTLIGGDDDGACPNVTSCRAQRLCAEVMKTSSDLLRFQSGQEAF